MCFKPLFCMLLPMCHPKHALREKVSCWKPSQDALAAAFFLPKAQSCRGFNGSALGLPEFVCPMAQHSEQMFTPIPRKLSKDISFDWCALVRYLHHTCHVHYERDWYVGMDQYLLILFFMGWTSIYQLFWCSPGVQGFDTLPCVLAGLLGLLLTIVLRNQRQGLLAANMSGKHSLSHIVCN